MYTTLILHFAPMQGSCSKHHLFWVSLWSTTHTVLLMMCTVLTVLLSFCKLNDSLLASCFQLISPVIVNIEFFGLHPAASHEGQRPVKWTGWNQSTAGISWLTVWPCKWNVQVILMWRSEFSSGDYLGFDLCSICTSPSLLRYM